MARRNPREPNSLGSGSTLGTKKGWIWSRQKGKTVGGHSAKEVRTHFLVGWRLNLHYLGTMIPLLLLQRHTLLIWWVFRTREGWYKPKLEVAIAHSKIDYHSGTVPWMGCFASRSVSVKLRMDWRILSWARPQSRDRWWLGVFSVPLTLPCKFICMLVIC